MFKAHVKVEHCCAAKLDEKHEISKADLKYALAQP
jgi:hypothetical protein